jgi:hypothetical protein
VVPPAFFAAPEFPFGVVELANFVEAPFELVVVADEPFTLGVEDFAVDPVCAFAFVVFGP